MYKVMIEVVTPDYKYYNQLGGYGSTYSSKQDAYDAIEREISRWPNWSDGRKQSFRSHCNLVEVTQ